MKKINNRKLFRKNFLNKKEINLIMEDFYLSMIAKLKKDEKLKDFDANRISFLNNREQFDIVYNKAKKSKHWTRIYKNFSKLPSMKRIVIKKIKNFCKKEFSGQAKILNQGPRIYEIKKSRFFSMHQEQIESENGLVFFIALHNIKKSEGGLMFVKKDLNYTIPHFRNETKNRPEITNELSKIEKKIINSKFERKFLAGEAAIIGKHILHETAKKTKGAPRWSLIVRVGFR